MLKSRVHYGGVPCYSCRAFFRRNTQKQERMVCKEAGQCTVTHKDRKVCTDCRYQKCIRYIIFTLTGLNKRLNKGWIVMLTCSLFRLGMLP